MLAHLLSDQNYFDATDEPSMQIPFMYHYADLPGLSTQRSRQVIGRDFNTTLSGLPGNDGQYERPLCVLESHYFMSDSGMIS
jgi:putative alpha-1,2-mannosidase